MWILLWIKFNPRDSTITTTTTTYIDMSNILWRTLRGEKTSTPPIWLMRQAGRYLPEYMAIRKTCSSFIKFVYTPDKASEVTIQPIARFKFDAAILFADILTIPHALNQKVEVVKDQGPLLEPALTKENYTDLFYSPEKLNPVYESVKKIKIALPEIPLIGFSGAMWTLLTYMIEGQSTRDYSKTFSLIHHNPKMIDVLIELLIEACSDYLIKQIDAGAELVKIFDSWASYAPKEYFEKLILKPTAAIIKHIRAKYPDIPIICFPKGVGDLYIPFCDQIDMNVIALDHTIDLQWAKKSLPSNLIFQGNLDPTILLKGGDALKTATNAILENLSDKAFIFNLGHGIIKETPIKHVEQLMDQIRNP